MTGMREYSCSSDPPGLRRSRAQPAVRRIDACLVRPHMVIGALPADERPALAARPEKPDRRHPAHRHDGHHRRADPQRLETQGQDAVGADRCGEGGDAMNGPIRESRQCRHAAGGPRLPDSTEGPAHESAEQAARRRRRNPSNGSSGPSGIRR
jgi:hypothetical protein